MCLLWRQKVVVASLSYFKTVRHSTVTMHPLDRDCDPRGAKNQVYGLDRYGWRSGT